MKRILIFTMVLLSTMTAFADEFVAVNNDGLTISYNITSENPPEVYVTGIGYAYSGIVNIPEIVDYNNISYSVKGIDIYAMGDHSEITSLTIPNSVTTIGSYAFSGCIGITSLTIPNSVTTIGSSAFSGCIGITSLTIPNSVTTIESSAFNGCSGIESLTIPNSVTTIGSSAFSGCIGITSLTIHSSVTTIEYGAFSDCTALNTININANNINGNYPPNSIGDVFSGCTNFSVVFGDNVQTIPEHAFYYCSGITSLTIPNSVTYIGSSAFYNCTALNTVNYNAVNVTSNNIFSDCTNLSTVVFGNEVQTIPYSAFSGCSGITSLTIPNSVTTIGYSAFSGCSGIKSLTIPNSVLTIGYSAFYGCSGIESLTIGNSVNTIESSAFSGCSRITSLTIPNSVTSIGDGAFQDCSTLNTVIFNAANITYYPCSDGWLEVNPFSGCTSLSNIVFGEEVQTIPDYAFYNCSRITSLTIPNSVTYIGSYAFQNCTALNTVNYNAVNVISNNSNSFSGCTSLSTVVFGDEVQSIPNNAFYNCSGITSLTIGNSVNTIGNSAFSGCSGIESLTIGNSVNTIGKSAFYGCSRITSLTIPNSVTSILDYAFYNCSGITSLTIGNSVNTIGKSVFYGCSGITSLTIGNSVNTIGNYAFSGCNGITSLTIGNSVTTIGEGAFYNCYGISTLTIPNSVTTIGEIAFYYCTALNIVNFNAVNVTSYPSSYNPFYGCTSLSTVVFGNEVQTIPNYAFYNCSRLESVTIPNSVTTIGNSAFYGCSRLESVTIPNSVTTIGNSAFYGCSGITSPLIIPNSVLTIGNSAFYGCTGISSINIGNSVTEISANAFYNLSNLTQMTCLATTPPFTGADVFFHVPYSMVLHVPAESVHVYQRIHPWSCFNVVALSSQLINIDQNIANGTVSTSPSGYVIPSTAVTISANPNLGYALESISVYKTDEPSTIVTIYDNSFTMPDYDVTVTASFNESSAGLNYLTMSVPNNLLFGQNVPIEIGLNNESEITAAQFDISIPNDYYSVSSSDFSLGSRFSNHTISAAQQNASTWRIMIYSQTNQLISGNTGTIVNLTLHPNDGTPAGTYRCQIIEAILSNANAVNCHAGLLPTLDFTTLNLGDANGDGNINILDMVTVVNYIMENNPSPFIFTSADINSDNVINVLDVVGISTVIMGTRSDGGCTETLAEYSLEDGVFYLNSPVDIAGLQFDIEGQYPDIELLESLPGFEWQQAQMPDGTHRFILYSLCGNTIQAGRHALLKTDSNSLSNIILADANGCEVTAVNEITSISEESGNAINQVYPNPFKDAVTISYSIGNNISEAKLMISNIYGQVVEVHPLEASRGQHTYKWDASSGIAAGVYHVVLIVNGTVNQSFKLIKSK